MQMESETINMLMSGFFIVMGLFLIVMLRLYFKYRSKSFFWFIGQSLFLIFAFFKLIDLLQRNPQIPEVMQSEENSLSLGITGMLWAISMVFMTAGINSIITELKRKAK